MSDVIKLDYEMAEKMIQAFVKGQQQLIQTRAEMDQLAQDLEDGALVGLAGDTMKQAVRERLNGAIGKLSNKFEEMAGDVRAAVNHMKQADDDSASELSTS